MSKGKKFWVVCYIISAFLTGAYYSERHELDWHNSSVQSVVVGMAWPIYWGSRAALSIVDPERLPCGVDDTSYTKRTMCNDNR
jgi:hypothetical protein